MITIKGAKYVAPLTLIFNFKDIFTFFSFLLIKLIIPAAPNKANIRPAIANHLLFFLLYVVKESGLLLLVSSYEILNVLMLVLLAVLFV